MGLHPDFYNSTQRGKDATRSAEWKKIIATQPKAMLDQQTDAPVPYRAPKQGE